MWNRWSFLILIVGVLAGYGINSPSARAQGEPLPFSVGDTVTLWYGHDASQSSIGSSVQCTVGEIRGDYVRCTPGNRIGATDRPERWVTLKYVVQVTKRND